jgi:ParB family chromosome partitioning protein
MIDDGKRRGLGRGLSALLGDPSTEEVTDDAPKTVRTMPVETLHPGRFQPRRHFDEERIADLVESVREKGVLQPLLVRRDPEDDSTFEIIAGERRWRAAQLAQLHEVPVIVKEFTDREALEVALVENLQRQDLSPLEEADGYRRLLDEFHHTQEDLAKAVGKSRSHVANTLRLLALPDPIKTMLDGGQLTAGHARALLTSADPVKLAQQVVAKGLNVRQTEKLVQQPDKKAGGNGAAKLRDTTKDPDTAALERDLQQILGLKVNIRFHGKGGDLTITYGSLEQLDDILHRLSHGGREAARAVEPMDEEEDAAF